MNNGKQIGFNGEFGRGKLWSEPQKEEAAKQLRDVKLSITRGSARRGMSTEDEKQMVPVRRFATSKIGLEPFSRPKL